MNHYLMRSYLKKKKSLYFAGKRHGKNKRKRREERILWLWLEIWLRWGDLMLRAPASGFKSLLCHRLYKGIQFISVFFSYHFFSWFAIIKWKMVLLSFLLVRMMAFNIESFHEPWECRPCNNIRFFHCHMSNYNKLSIFHPFMCHAQGEQTIDLPLWEDKKKI